MKNNNKKDYRILVYKKYVKQKDWELHQIN